VQLLSDDINIWDMLKNRRFHPSDIYSRLTFLEYWNPSGITQILWGKMPETDFPEVNLRTGFDHDSTIVSFKTVNTKYGEIVSKAEINLKDSESLIEISISKREYNLFNESLVRKIPDNIPWN
jgi:hypothetical protein